MADRPVRLRLSRRPGFDLQRLSRETNGLEAVKVTRPGIWGNPFTVTSHLAAGANIRAVLIDEATGGGYLNGYIAVPTMEDAVDCYREMMACEGEPGTRAYELRALLGTLRGRNLACWCRLDQPCHADILLELSNRPACEAVESEVPLTLPALPNSGGGG